MINYIFILTLQTLAELREEFGYNVNPLDNYMKEIKVTVV